MPKRKAKKRNRKLPCRILSLPNADKKWHEDWEPDADMLNFPHPFRAVICARPNTGKTTIVKNILLRQDPPFRKLYVVHVDADYTEEYDDVEAEYLEEIPSPQSHIFDGKKKTLLILEDLEFKFMPKIQLRNLDRLFGYVSTHKNVSVCVLAQDAFNLPPAIRRMSNIWILGKIDNDTASFMDIARRCGIPKHEFVDIYENHIKGDHDSLWIDNTKKTKWPRRINGYTALAGSGENNNKIENNILDNNIKKNETSTTTQSYQRNTDRLFAIASRAAEVKVRERNSKAVKAARTN